MNKCSLYGSFKEKRKEENNFESVQPARLKTREGRTPLLNAINFPGKGILPWKLIILREADLNGQCLKENPFLCFWQRTGFGEEEGEITYWCMPTELTHFFSFLFFLCFSVFSLIFPFSSFFLVTPCSYFLIFKFSILSSSLPSLLLLYTARASFYSTYRDWILLFQPLTAFVWSGCTC